jgi:hypothetical protein
VIIAGASFKIAQLQAFSNRLSRNNAIRIGHNLIIGPGNFILQPALYDQIAILLQTDWRLPNPYHLSAPSVALLPFHVCTTTPEVQTPNLPIVT